jgi:hypothetical protein
VQAASTVITQTFSVRIALLTPSLDRSLYTFKSTVKVVLTSSGDIVRILYALFAATGTNAVGLYCASPLYVILARRHFAYTYVPSS